MNSYAVNENILKNSKYSSNSKYPLDKIDLNDFAERIEKVEDRTLNFIELKPENFLFDLLYFPKLTEKHKELLEEKVKKLAYKSKEFSLIEVYSDKERELIYANGRVFGNYSSSLEIKEDEKYLLLLDKNTDKVYPVTFKTGKKYESDTLGGDIIYYYFDPDLEVKAISEI